VNRRAKAAVLAITLCGVGLAAPTWAQEPAKRVVSASGKPERYLALDVFGGYAGGYEGPQASTREQEEAESLGAGWDVGATISVGVRWIGITGTFGRVGFSDMRTYQVLVGPRFTTPWAIAGSSAARLFGHVLAGYVTAGGPTPTNGGAEWIVGGGVDLFLFRVQGDYVRMNLPGLPRNNGRVFVGGVVPLCFRACRESDGFNLSGRPAAK
jgi:hypothetical protein